MNIEAIGYLRRLESLVLEIKQSLANQRFKKEWYSVREAAVELSLNEQTVRKKCRSRQLSPVRKRNGVGRFDKVEWEISHAAIEHYQNHKWSGGDTRNGRA